jgi:hypothetical protein
MIDECAPACAAHLRKTMVNLLLAGAVCQPSHWLNVLTEVVFSGGAASTVGGGANGGAVDGGATGAGGGDKSVQAQNGEDDGDDEQRVGSTNSKPSQACEDSTAMGAGHVGGGGGTAGIARVLSTVALRLRTRLLACELLMLLVRRATTADGGAAAAAAAPAAPTSTPAHDALSRRLPVS